MKVSVAAVAILLIAAFCSLASSGPQTIRARCCASNGNKSNEVSRLIKEEKPQIISAGGNFGPDTTVCCFSYATRKLPQSHLKEYFYTSGKCSQPAVVFVTRKNQQVCTNPDTKWVKDYVNFLEMK